MRLLLTSLVLTTALGAQKNSKAGYDRSARATLVHDAIVYVTPDDTAEKVAEVLPGHEVVVIEHSGAWVKVFANTDEADKVENEPEFSSDDVPVPASGWIKDKGLVTPDTPGGDAILYGTAAALEDEAEQPHAPKNAASEAHFLYRRVFEYYPTSALSGEAAFRSADIRWQLEKADISTLPSAKEQESYLRPQIYEGDMKRVMKTYPGSDQAAEAAYELLDNKLCGDWQGLPKCPDMEAGLYLKYAEQHPTSPKAAQALFNAVYREGVLVTMYQVQDEGKRAVAAAEKAQKLAAEMQRDYAQSEYTRRAQSIAFRIKQGISIYGTDRD